MLHQLKN